MPILAGRFRERDLRKSHGRSIICAVGGSRDNGRFPIQAQAFGHYGYLTRRRQICPNEVNSPLFIRSKTMEEHMAIVRPPSTTCRLIVAGVVLMSGSIAIAAARALPTVKPIIDIHVHTAGLGAHGSGCFVAPVLRDSYKFSWYLRAFGVSREELQRVGDARVFERIAERVAASTSVQQAVVLAMDGVVGNDGALDRARTQVYVPNDFVQQQTDRYESLLFGASVNPYRHDAVARLHEVKSAGAVLVKWIPAIMAIDPADPRIIPFYESLVELDLPLLVHVGQERSFSAARDELGDPVRLTLPLDIGVIVIAAHIATTGKNHGEGNFERLLPLFARYANLIYGNFKSHSD